jgi:hypothetical protein
VGEPEVLETGRAGGDRPLYGIDGPRRRPRAKPEDDAGVVDLSAAEAQAASNPADGATAPPLRVRPGLPGIRDRWHEESFRRAAERAGAAPADRAALGEEVRRQVEDAVRLMQETFEAEIEALRTTNREEAKRFRSANGEAFVRVRVANTEELERIRTTIDDGIARLCGVLDGQLERLWRASDAELERIRAVGAERLAEVHDLLTDAIERIRVEQAPPPDRRWLRLRRAIRAR